MSNTTAPFASSTRAGRVICAPVYQGVSLLEGALACLDANGNAVNAADAANLRMGGRVQDYNFDNTDGATGDLNVPLSRDPVLVNNSTGDPIVQSDLLKMVYIEDDTTANHTGGNNKVVAGLFLGFAA